MARSGVMRARAPCPSSIAEPTVQSTSAFARCFSKKSVLPAPKSLKPDKLLSLVMFRLHEIQLTFVTGSRIYRRMISRVPAAPLAFCTRSHALAWECRLRRSASSSRAKNHDPWDAPAIGSEKPLSPTS